MGCMALPIQEIAMPRQCMEILFTVKIAALSISIAATGAEETSLAAATIMARRLRWLPRKRAKKTTTLLCMALPIQEIAMPRQCMEILSTVKIAALSISIAATFAEETSLAAAPIMARRLRWLPWKRSEKTITPLCMALPKRGIARPRRCMDKFPIVKNAAKRISIVSTSADKSIAAACMARRLRWLSRKEANMT